MAKTKTCHYCNEETERLFYANPKCCGKWQCKKKYNEEKEKSKGSSGSGAFGSSKTREAPKRKTIAPISKKKQEELKLYRKNRDKYFKEHPVCEFPGCSSRDISLHHSRGRIGALLTDMRHFKSLCWPHHKWCEENPSEAKKLGLSKNRLDHEPEPKDTVDNTSNKHHP